MQCKYTAIFAFLFIFCLSGMLTAAPDDAIVKGRVIDAEGEGLPAGNIILENSLLGASTDTEGYFEFIIPARFYRDKQVKLTANFIGYESATQEVELNAGENVLTFELAEDILNLETIVVTGLASETTKEKTPFSVSVVDRDLLEAVPAVSPETAIQGKVAGAQVVKGSGKPGQGASVLLRGATSIDASSGDVNNNDRDPLNITGRSQDPLYIVDGVILASTPEDLDAIEIESMEIIKGAAASSLYGSRAANGVIQIKTKRGSNLSTNHSLIKFRSEYGVNALGNELNYSRYHKYLSATESYVDDNGAQVNIGDWINADGNKVQRIARLIDGGEDGKAFKDNPYVNVFDHTDQVFRTGTYNTNTLSLSRNLENTNFLMSYTNHKDIGIVELADGYTRNTFKLNLDHRLRPELHLGISSQYSVSESDEIDDSGTMRNPIEELNKTEADVDLTTKNENGEYVSQPNTAYQTDNPLYWLDNADLDYKRERILGSLDLRYYPLDWFDLEANLSMDRLEVDNFEYYKKGFESTYLLGIRDGQMTQENGTNMAVNASITAGFRKRFGDFNTRTKLRYLYEKYDFKFLQTQGQELTVKDITSWQNVEGIIINQSFKTLSLAEGIYFIGGVDYRDKYILDFLVRRDGSSLFGEDERYHNYHRFSGAWRLSEEGFWNIRDQVNEFKLHYSRGTAGSRPIFAAQYEAFSLNDGSVGKDRLGNKELKPEYSTEHEAGLSAAFFNRYSLEMNYAKTTVEDQILLVPQVGYKGFGSQWQNAGVVTSNSLELTLEGLAYRTRNHSLSFGVTFDRTRSTIDKLDIPPFQYGFGQDGAQFYVKEGEEVGSIYGRKWVKDKSDLPEEYQDHLDMFQTNDEGYVVYVGEGNTWREGIEKDLWNTRWDVDGDGSNDVYWGEPIKYEDADGNDYFKLGRTTPDYNLGLNMTYRWKGLSVYMLWNAQVGGIIYNLNKAWMYTAETHSDMDQAGKPDGEKKPVGYYDNFTGGLLADELFAEDGTFYKLREMAVSYSLNQNQIRPLFGNLVSRVTLTLMGRNLLTFTDYDGYDPEVGIQGRNSGSSVIGRIDDDVTYPHYRTFSFAVGLEF